MLLYLLLVLKFLSLPATCNAICIGFQRGEIFNSVAFPDTSKFEIDGEYGRKEGKYFILSS